MFWWATWTVSEFVWYVTKNWSNSRQFKKGKVALLFKVWDPKKVSNYRTISVLTCFSKILDQITYNRLCKYLVEQKVLYKKQFGFQTGHSTDHAIVKLVDQITNPLKMGMTH